MNNSIENNGSSHAKERFKLKKGDYLYSPESDHFIVVFCDEDKPFTMMDMGGLSTIDNIQMIFIEGIFKAWHDKIKTKQMIHISKYEIEKLLRIKLTRTI